VSEGRWGQKGIERTGERENMFYFHQTKLQHLYTHLNAYFGEIEVFTHMSYIMILCL
jgi:hypothetical protein